MKENFYFIDKCYEIKVRKNYIQSPPWWYTT